MVHVSTYKALETIKPNELTRHYKYIQLHYITRALRWHVSSVEWMAKWKKVGTAADADIECAQFVNGFFILIRTRISKICFQIDEFKSNKRYETSFETEKNAIEADRRRNSDAFQTEFWPGLMRARVLCTLVEIYMTPFVFDDSTAAMDS